MTSPSARQAEEALENSESRYRELFNNSKNALVIYEAIDDGRDFILKEFNHAAEKIEQIKKEALIGKFLTEAFPGVKEFGLLEVLRRVWKTGKPEDYPVAFYQDERISGWRDNYVYKLPSGEIVVIYEDITERKQYEAALREREERFRTIAGSSLSAIITADSNGKILFWNKAAEAIYGYKAKEIVGKSIELLRPRGKRLVDRKNRENFIKTGHSPYIGKTVEGQARKKDGTAFLSETSTSSFKIGGKIMFCGIVRDITERKRMEQELQTAHDELEKKVKQRTVELSKTNKELQAAKEYLKKFSGKLLEIREEERRNISRALHDELGSMSVSVGSKISIAKEELKDNNAKAALRNLKQGETVLRKAVADIRKLAVDLRPPSLENMGLSAALRDYIETIKKHSKIRITFRNDLGNKKILGATAIAIYRVAQEAVTNISKHSQAKKVRVRLYADNKNIKLNVTDDGVGFDVDKIYSYSKRGRFKMGIEGMKERIEALGGVLVIKSILRKGTLIKAVLPKE